MNMTEGVKIITNFKGQTQVSPYWCWAAVAVSIWRMDHPAAGRDDSVFWTQCRLVDAIEHYNGEVQPGQIRELGTYHCQSGGPLCAPAPNCADLPVSRPIRCITREYIQENSLENALEFISRYVAGSGYQLDIIQRVIDAPRIKQNIDNDRPVVIKRISQVGFDYLDHFNVIYGYAGSGYYRIFDPGQGDDRWCSANELSDWQETIYVAFNPPTAGANPA